MANTTQGFGVNVMPQLGAVNPSMVAFNPNQATQGLLQSYQIADTVAKLKAFKAKQKELEDTRMARVQAENARNIFGTTSDTARIGTIAPSVALDIEKATQGIRAIAPRTDFDIAQAKEGLRSLTPKTDAEIAAANVATFEAGTALETGSDRRNLAKLKLASELDAQPIQADIKLSELLDAQQNSAFDFAQRRAAEAAKIQASTAEAARNRATADNLKDATTLAREKMASQEAIAEARQNKAAQDVKMFSVIADKASSNALYYDTLAVIDPGDPKGPTTTVAALITKYFDENKITGELKVKPNSFWNKLPETSQIKQIIDRRIEATKEATKARNQALKITSDYLRREYPDAAQPQVGSGNSEIPQFKSLDDAKRAMPQGGPVIINGVPGTLQPKK